MNHLLLIHTGGTIAMSQSGTGHVEPSDVNPIDATLPKATDIAHITTKHFSNIPSPHMTPEKMLELAQFIQRELTQDTYDGVVITHGTDTLEETAYFLQITLGAPVPIVLTGAMRPSNEVGSDGEFNLITALRVAKSEAARGKGVLVVFNGEIHSAFNVTKTHTSSVDTFKSVHFGNVGMVTKDHVNDFVHFKTCSRIESRRRHGTGFTRICNHAWIRRTRPRSVRTRECSAVPLIRTRTFSQRDSRRDRQPLLQRNRSRCLRLRRGWQTTEGDGCHFFKRIEFTKSSFTTSR